MLVYSLTQDVFTSILDSTKFPFRQLDVQVWPSKLHQNLKHGPPCTDSPKQLQNYSNQSTSTTSSSPPTTGRVSSSSNNTEASSSTTSRDGPQPKQTRTKAFPRGLGDAPVVTAPQVGAPTPKGPPAGMVPPFEPQQAPTAQEQRPPSPCAAAAQCQPILHPDHPKPFDEALQMAKKNKFNIIEKDPNQQLIQYVKSPKNSDINWTQPLHMSSFGHNFQVIQPVLGFTATRNLVEVVNYKTDSQYYLDLKEAAAWILAGKLFNTLEQPMTIVVWTQG